MAAARVTDTDKGAKKLLAAVAKAANGRKITVGIHAEEGSQGEDGGLTVGDVAQFAEFGTAKAPARSWCGAWADENQEKHRENMRRLGQEIVKGTADVDQRLDQIALSYEGSMKERISAGIEPPNAEATVRRKGSSVPLIDKGQFRSSIRAKVTT